MQRTVVGFLSKILAISLPLLVVLWVFYPLPPMQERSTFVLVLTVFFFLTQALKCDKKTHFYYNLVLAGLCAVVFGYVALNYAMIETTLGITKSYQMVFCVIAILLVLEATRRTMGLALTLVIVFFFAYGLFGQYIPYKWGGHSGFGLDRLASVLYLTPNGLFGQVLYTLYKYVFLFVVFGSMLAQTGALDFITDFAKSLVGRFRGGAAMISTVASGMVGSINGSAVANVTITGTATIPMMKKMGFEPHMAGAVEASASTGGQIMPPVMGTVAFLIMTNLGITYLEVAKAALPSAVLYFVAIMLSVYIYAYRKGIKGIPVAELPKLKSVCLKLNSLVFISAMSILIVLLIMRYSPIYAALYAMLAMFVVSFFGKETRLTFKKMVEVLEGASKTFASIGIAGVCIGVIVGVVTVTGLAPRFSGLIINLSGGNLVFALILTMFASIVLGTGLPTVVTYALLALLVIPTLLDLGVIPLAAHMFVFYAGMLSMVTPPVAMAAFAGATIAEANMWRTGLAACVLSAPAYILPYIFVMDNSLLLIGTATEAIIVIMKGLFACALLSLALIGPAQVKMQYVQRMLYFLAAVFFVPPQHYLMLIGVAIAVIAFALNKVISTSHSQKLPV